MTSFKYDFNEKMNKLLTCGFETIVEDEVWKFNRPISKTEAKELAEAAFHDCFDLLQHAVHGDGDS